MQPDLFWTIIDLIVILVCLLFATMLIINNDTNPLKLLSLLSVAFGTTLGLTTWILGENT